MKLNKMELVALAARITEELHVIANEKQKALDVIQDTQNKPAAERALKAVKTMNITLKTYLEKTDRGFKSISLQHILESMRENQTEINIPKRYSDNSVFDKLVIAQIDCPDIETMIEKVKASFIKI